MPCLLNFLYVVLIKKIKIKILYMVVGAWKFHYGQTKVCLQPKQITLRRTWGKMPLWHKAKLLYTITFQAFFLPSQEDLNKMVSSFYLQEWFFAQKIPHFELYKKSSSHVAEYQLTIMWACITSDEGNGQCRHVDSCDSGDEQGVPHSNGDPCTWARPVSILLRYIIFDVIIVLLLKP